MTLGPLSFIPKRVPKIWGSETWQVYDRPGDSARVAEGPAKGQTLNALMLEYGPNLLGQAAFERGATLFPLAFKIIEAKESLSLQVHPDDDQALRLAKPGEAAEMGKSEMWMLLKAEPGAQLTVGLKPGTSRERFLAAVKSGEWGSILQNFEVRPGDAVSIPAGQLHAIGKGCVVAELQQNSDVTLRVHDFGRLENGKPRELQLSQALECIRFESTDSVALATVRRMAGSEERLVEGPHFTVSRLALDAPFSPPAGSPRFHLLHCLTGRAAIRSQQGSLEFAEGASVLLPASLIWSVEPSGGSTSLLWSRP